MRTPLLACLPGSRSPPLLTPARLRRTPSLTKRRYVTRPRGRRSLSLARREYWPEYWLERRQDRRGARRRVSAWTDAQNAYPTDKGIRDAIDQISFLMWQLKAGEACGGTP